MKMAKWKRDPSLRKPKCTAVTCFSAKMNSCVQPTEVARDRQKEMLESLD